MNDGEASGPFKLQDVLFDELECLGRDPGPRPAPALKDVYQKIGQLEPDKVLSALCLSGGGIRSATFNLGVIQALARLQLLGRFDYLSSVSGGGYIAAWLRKWLHVEPLDKVVRALAWPAEATSFDPLAPEPKPVDHLRQFSNYLTPRLGLFSADTWAAVALIVRNLILNWLVLLPVLAAIVAIPQAALIVAGSAALSCDLACDELGLLATRVALVLALVASTAIYWMRRKRETPASESRILLFGVVPLWSSCLALSLAGLLLPERVFRDPDPTNLLQFCLLWCIGVPLLGWAIARLATWAEHPSPSWKGDVAGIGWSGLAATCLLYELARTWLLCFRDTPWLFVVSAVPTLLGLYLGARALFVAFASVGETEGRTPPPGPPESELGYADREWWARLSGWVLILALSWMGISFLVTVGIHLVTRYADKAVAAVGGLTGALGLIAALLGASPRTAPRTGAARTPPSPLRNWGLKLLAPASLLFLVLLLAQLTTWLARQFSIETLLDVTSKDPAHDLTKYGAVELLLRFLAIPISAIFISWLLGFVVNVNRFSAHGLYRDRLIRAFLGASNPDRQPNPFTGFDPRDNVPLHELKDGASLRPLPVVNVTLNLVSGQRLAWQQRKAESFSMTPLYCGNFDPKVGYRRSEEYGGKNGVSLGTAITISGAAANPSSGYHSSPLVGFLMTLFNVRLGCWLGNPNEHGQDTCRLSGPRHAWWCLFADLFGRTDDRHAYVSLSDGGHFENLGVYEMILRRCRLIVASDAGQDDAHDFEDLGNLIRKVRIDFGISIRFERPIFILPRTDNTPGLTCALGTIAYDEVDEGTPPGHILYLKPTLRASGAALPYDVFSYARGSGAFPQEPTGDQWFSEAQFESYRALGQHLVSQLGSGRQFDDLPSFFEAVRRDLDTAASAPGFPKTAIV
jgi:hypothetical protein